MSEPIYVVKPSLPPIEEYINEIKKIWDSNILTNSGPEHEAFQKQLELFFGIKNVSLFANGHLALELGINALELDKGEVITTPFTFASTTMAILRNGLTPVFCDVRDDNFTIDAQKIESLINSRTVAILPVHVYGNICDVDAINELANKYNLNVIYDAAHAFGEKYKGRNVASFGDMSMFSFHATKVFNSVEGGCLTFSDDKYVNHLNMLKQFGEVGHTESYPLVGTNAKMTEMHAAMGICNLNHVTEYINKRKKVIERYRKNLIGINYVRIPYIQEEVESNYSYFPIVIEGTYNGKNITRQHIEKELLKHDIHPRKYFYPLTSDFECLTNMSKILNFKINDTPIARYYSDRILCLPCYADLELNVVDQICEIIADGIRFYKIY